MHESAKTEPRLRVYFAPYFIMNEYINKVIHADCMSILPNIESGSIDLIVTDIPYGISYKSSRQTFCGRSGVEVHKDKEEYFSQIANDSEMPIEWIPEAYRVLKDYTAMYIFCHWSKWHILYPEIERHGFAVKNMIILNKSNHGMGDLKGGYAPKHELLCFATKGRHILKGNSRMNDVCDVPVKYSGSKRMHPNEKPECWVSPCIRNSTINGDVVLDPFAGCGTTANVCKKMGRRFVAIEIDEKHYLSAEKRLSENQVDLFGS